MGSIEKYIENKFGPRLRLIETEFGSSAATLAKTLLTAFGKNPGEDAEIREYLREAVENEIIFLDRRQAMPVLAYRDNNRVLQPLFHLVSQKTPGVPCVRFWYEDDRKHIFELNPLVNRIIEMASDTHVHIGAWKAPSFAPGETSAELTDAQEELVIHLLEQAYFL